MKKLTMFLVLAFAIVVGCDDEKDKIEKLIQEILLNKNLSPFDKLVKIREFNQGFRPMVQEIKPYEAYTIFGADTVIDFKIRDYNNKNGMHKIDLINKRFEKFKVSELRKFVSTNVPDDGFLFLEFGLKNKNINGKKINYNNQILRISSLDNKDKYVNSQNAIITPDSNVNFDNSKKNLKEAYKLLSVYGIKHFDTTNYGGVKFEKKQTLRWLDSLDKIKPNENLYINQTSDVKNKITFTSAIFTNNPNIKKVKDEVFPKFLQTYSYGNRGSNCCP